MRADFARAAATYDGAAVLARETGRRLGERLSLTRLAPRRIADIGCATGDGARDLAMRYPGAHVLAVDFARPMLSAVRAREPWLRRLRGLGPQPVQADCRQLPLADGSVDLVWSNLVLHWLDDPQPALAELHRVLAIGGLLTFAVFGPDTAKEWHAATSNYSGGGTAHGRPPARRLMDMHDWGDLLAQTGFADPVMDRDDIVLSYGSGRQMLADQRHLGVRNALFGVPRWRAVRAALRDWPRDAEGRRPLTFEVAFGQAWKAPPRRNDGVQPVTFHQRPKSLR